MKKRTEVSKGYVRLNDLGLSYYDIGVEKKIYDAITDKLDKIETQEIYVYVLPCELSNNDSRKYKAYRKGYYNNPIACIIDKSYKIKYLIKFFETTNTVMYKRKLVEFDNQKYLEILKNIKG